MTERSAMFLFVLGLVLTMAAVGGVENSETAVELAQSLAVAVVALAMMAVGALTLKDTQ